VHLVHGLSNLLISEGPEDNRPAGRRGPCAHGLAGGRVRMRVRRPSASVRLSMDARGRILYAFRRPHGNARTHVVFTPKSLLERLCALIPYPRTHLITYHGVLASASSWRDEVVPAPTYGLSIGVPKGCFEPGSSSRGLPDVGSGGGRGPKNVKNVTEERQSSVEVGLIRDRGPVRAEGWRWEPRPRGPGGAGSFAPDADR